MKNILKIVSLTFTAIVVLVACKKDEHKDYFEGGTAPVLTANRTATIPLSFATKDNEAIKLTWTNPEYKFTTGVSSQDVTYLIEIDTTGANFTNPNRQSLSISKNLERTFTQTEFNDYLLNQLVLVPGISHNIEIRVTSSLAGNTVPLFSNVLKFTVTPYAIPPKVVPPTNSTLWITGDAVAGPGYSSWNNPLPPPYDVTFKFTKISNTLYELTLNMPGGGGYKLIQQQGDWSQQYHMLTGGTWQGGDFEKRDADPAFPGPPSGGSYKITVDFQRGKFIVVKL